jgi:hyperosmotically inducible protein
MKNGAAGEPGGQAQHYSIAMKSSLKRFVLIGLCAGGLAWLPAGCAGTATKESTGEYVDDSTITTKVKAQFVGDDTVKAFDVKVETFKGIVSLSGFVNTPEQKTRAEQIAAGVTGVRQVNNNITLK